ncbi:MAG: hypothetical protein RDU59_07215 [Thermodesulfobacteriota bacterium]|nr:hypothetical protein [Thermodesulfobacteriota bacterium]
MAKDKSQETRDDVEQETFDFEGLELRPIQLLGRLLMLSAVSGAQMQAEDMVALGLLLKLYADHFRKTQTEEARPQV